MKKNLVLMCFVFILLIGFAGAADFPSPQDKYVNDFAHVLTNDQINQIRGLFAGVDQDTTAEVVFVSIDSLNGNDISQYAVQLASNWKVGKADKSNGLVILYAKQENKIFAATGYGLEGILPDSKVGRLLDQCYVPMRDSNNTAQGIIDFSKAVAQVIEDNKAEVLSGQAGSSSNTSIDPFFVFIVIVALFTIISRILAGKKSGKRPRFWWIPIFLPFPRSGGGGGFGGGGFGGGGFGGGGAGR